MNSLSKNRYKIVFGVIIIAVIAVLLFVFGPTIKESEREIGRYDSPDGAYTIIAIETNGGATTSFGLICKLHRNNSKFSFDRKIFTEYPALELDVEWVDNDTVIINGKRIENVLIDKESVYHTKPVYSSESFQQ